MKKISFLILILIIKLTEISAQGWCGSTNHRNDLIKNDPKKAKILDKRLENFNLLQQENTLKGIKNNTHYIIPVVFHVIHQAGTENISLEQIEDQMRILNEDFARENSDTINTPPYFAALAGDANIEFRLAQIDPEGNCTQGVTRTFSNLTVNARNNVKELIQWDPEKYMNVWVVRTIENFGESGNIVLGFAQFPDQLWEDAATDGIVIRHDYCGSIGSASGAVGRTLTHEAGHWLNLIHIWGDQDCGNDYVDDTPIALEPNYNVCTNDYPWHVGDLYCGLGNNGEMFMNYMDYVDDECMNMFSNNQGTRMRSAINQFRGNLTTEDNLIATGTNNGYVVEVCTPIAEFVSNYTYGCVGDGFNFESETYNINIDDEVSYEWYFVGGSPSTSNSPNPTVSYLNPGIYSVSLTVSNEVGSNTIIKEGFISISDDDTNMPSPYIQNFESSEFPTYINNPIANWTLIETTDPSWERTIASSSPNITAIDNEENIASIRIRSANFTQEGELHTMISPSINLANTSIPVRVYFDLAYARKNSNSMDNLIIYASNDCGRTWTKRFDKSTDQLITNGGANSFFDFVPNDNQWVEFNVNLNMFVGEPSILLKIEFSGMEGNWLYLDNFIVTESNQLSLSQSSISEIKIYPNPSKGFASVEFESHSSEILNITTINIFGDIIEKQKIKVHMGKNIVNLNEMFSKLNAGIYFIEMVQNNYKNTFKIIITE